MYGRELSHVYHTVYPFSILLFYDYAYARFMVGKGYNTLGVVM